MSSSELAWGRVVLVSAPPRQLPMRALMQTLGLGPSARPRGAAGEGRQPLLLAACITPATTFTKQSLEVARTN
eukprot:8754675-Pyramimonas_sp.AAC.1